MLHPQWKVSVHHGHCRRAPNTQRSRPRHKRTQRTSESGQVRKHHKALLFFEFCLNPGLS